TAASSGCRRAVPRPGRNGIRGVRVGALDSYDRRCEWREIWGGLGKTPSGLDRISVFRPKPRWARRGAAGAKRGGLGLKTKPAFFWRALSTRAKDSTGSRTVGLHAR